MSELLERIAQTEERARTLEAELADPELARSPQAYARVAKELGRLRPVLEVGERYRLLTKELAEAREMLREGDAQTTLHHTHIHIIRSVDVFRLALPSTTAALQVARICAPRQGPHAASVLSRRPQCVGAVSVSGHTYCQ